MTLSVSIPVQNLANRDGLSPGEFRLADEPGFIGDAS